jgi:hypothetical protein
MNERIKLLAEQATITELGVDNGFDRVTFDKQKFAELIVEECGEVAYKAFWDNPETVRGIHIKEKIKQHFGVE